MCARCSLHGRGQADLRHEPRFGRLPVERVSRVESAQHRRGEAVDRASSADGAADQRGGEFRAHAINDVSMLRKPLIPTSHSHQRLGGHVGTDRPWRAGRDARRLHRLQSLGERPHSAAQRAAAGADADLGLSTAPLAWRAAAGRTKFRFEVLERTNARSWLSPITTNFATSSASTSKWTGDELVLLHDPGHSLEEPLRDSFGIEGAD